MADDTLFRILLALAALLVAAKISALVLGRLRCPPVIGEILGGLLLGPTLLGALAPGLSQWLFPEEGPVHTAIEVTYQLGMLLLMFLAGAEMRTVFTGGNRRVIGAIAITGLAVPFAAGLLATRVIDLSPLQGPAHDPTALSLIIAVAAAVASIPVISRILLDLRILDTAFARTVISIAVLEDIVLNVVIAVAVAMVHAGDSEAFGAVSLFGIESHVGIAVFDLAVTAGCLAAGLLLMRMPAVREHPAVAAVRRISTSVLGPVGRVLILVLIAACVCLFLGITPILGTFAVGLAVGRDRRAAEFEGPIRGFATAFFIPLYFAVVGLKLDLIHHFDVLLTVGFIAVTWVVKGAGSYFGGRIGGARAMESANYAVALNARGGPGIVLATVALDAGIVSEKLFTTLVLAAVLTSLLAGWWLQLALRRGWLPTEEPERAVAHAVS
ncbi:cation:proton antiporter [Nocardia mexicana]|uniref:Transporter (CPA2 family) n=1 Tax=Nocardia mexicana TaxID=279262 RepID=A0A370GNS9_9NOCA|nr:cation:proton antiporter [Nocardia mexicana]RDI44936.1 transporter (CPA2 family) [Nocardia mexicana]